jgi:hypothetical protein
MSDSVRTTHGKWKLEELLLRHPGLRIVPSQSGDLTLAGDLSFYMQGPANGPIEDTYSIWIQIPADFPSEIPEVRETTGRIPPDFHKLEDGSLCLASPTELRLALTLNPTLPRFVDRFVLPYLFGYSYSLKFGSMPFGELAHGPKGILQYVAQLFGADFISRAQEFVRLASMKKRDANKRRCPCQSGRRLGACHHERVNAVRDRLGRTWFRDEFSRITDLIRENGELEKQSSRNRSPGAALLRALRPQPTRKNEIQENECQRVDESKQK